MGSLIDSFFFTRGGERVVGVVSMGLAADGTAVPQGDPSAVYPPPGGGGGGSAPVGAALDGTDATGIIPPSGAVGIRGWLSGIYARLAGTLTVALPTGAATDATLGGKLDTLNATITGGRPGTTTYAKASAASSLVVKSAAGSLTYAYVLASASGFLIAIDAVTSPTSGATLTGANAPIGLWPCPAGQQSGGSYTDAPIPVTSGLVLLVSSSATVYTPVSATFIQGGAR